jgi:capsule polysaccharide modification protein KpsS
MSGFVQIASATIAFFLGLYFAQRRWTTWRHDRYVAKLIQNAPHGMRSANIVDREAALSIATDVVAQPVIVPAARGGLAGHWDQVRQSAVDSSLKQHIR